MRRQFDRRYFDFFDLHKLPQANRSTAAQTDCAWAAVAVLSAVAVSVPTAVPATAPPWINDATR